MRASMEPGHEDREYLEGIARKDFDTVYASMEPGHEDREYKKERPKIEQVTKPQWSPVMKTGNTSDVTMRPLITVMPQWSPVMKTGNTSDVTMRPLITVMPQWSPVMKTGNTRPAPGGYFALHMPQWSPVMKTGNTPHEGAGAGPAPDASMEPGHEDREYLSLFAGALQQVSGLNGARS